jgi:hypothetical protein
MEQIPTPKKERKFLKAIGRVAGVLVQELALGLGRKYIGKMINKIKIPKKRETLSFLLLLSCTFAFAQYPATGNKQRLGYQTTGDGLVFRGRSNDTTALKPSTLNNAYHLFDTVNNVLFSYIKTKGGWQFNNADTVIVNNNFTQPADSLFFKTSVSPNNVDTAKMRWDSELGTVVLGMYDQVPNELGFKNFWLVKNQTGSTITKGSIVYANGTVGASGRITVAKFIANGTIDAKYLLGITAHDLSNGEDGYVISFGKIRQVNTDTFADGAILYPSPTTAGVWTDVEPVAPNIDMPIGFCINSSLNNGTIAIRVASGYSLNELHNVAISSPGEKSSLYYSGGLWRDTTAALLVSDTASMLTNYLRTGVAVLTYTPLTRSISTTAPLQGGGDLSANRTFSITQASGSVNGFLSSTDWTTFNGKGNGTVTSVAMTVPTFLSVSGSPVTSSGTLAVSLSGSALPIANGGTAATTISQARTNLQVPNIATTITPQAPLTGGGSLAGDRTISIPVATSVANGYLSSTDWTTFNSKQNAITLTTTGTSGAATLVGATLNIPQYSGGSGTVTNISVTAPLTISNPTTTPLIQINAANGTSTSGVVTTTSQQFGGAKTFNDNLTTNGNMEVDGTLNVDLKGTFAAAIKATSLERNVVNTTGTSITLGIATTWLNIHQTSNFTITLPSAATYPGKEIHIRNSAAGVVLSASSNIIAIDVSHAGATTTIILTGTTGSQFCTLVSDGTNWIQTQIN